MVLVRILMSKSGLNTNTNAAVMSAIHIHDSMASMCAAWTTTAGVGFTLVDIKNISSQ
jgi:hypothetical protein